MKLINDSEQLINLGTKEGHMLLVHAKSTIEIDAKTEKLFHSELTHYVGNYMLRAERGVSKDTVKESKTIIDDILPIRRRKKAE